MRKRHAFRKHSSEQAYQPSDAVSVLAIAVTAIILVLSLFAMEHVAGVPVSVHGESASAPSDATTMTRRAVHRKQSLGAQRAAARRARAGTSGSASSSSAQACDDNSCSNLLSIFFQGDPSCMKDQRCVNAVYRIISKQPCSASDGCSSLAAAYAFFYANQSCITSFTDACRAGVAQAIRWAQ